MAAQAVRDGVVLERVRRRCRLGVTATDLDVSTRSAALPQPDEPEPAKAATGEGVELLVGNLIKSMDVATIGGSA